MQMNALPVDREGPKIAAPTFGEEWEGRSIDFAVIPNTRRSNAVFLPLQMAGWFSANPAGCASKNGLP